MSYVCCVFAYVLGAGGSVAAVGFPCGRERSASERVVERMLLSRRFRGGVQVRREAVRCRERQCLGSMGLNGGTEVSKQGGEDVCRLAGCCCYKNAQAESP